MIEITPKLWAIREDVYDERAYEITSIDERAERLVEKFKRDVAEHGVTPLHEPTFDHHQFVMHSYCDLDNCPYKIQEDHDIEDCAEHHPESITTSPPHDELIVKARCIPTEHEQYRQFFNVTQNEWGYSIRPGTLRIECEAKRGES
jgi:hypothetical protein